MVERLPALPGRLHEQGKLALERLLTDEILEPLRPQRAVKLLLTRPHGGDLHGDLACR
jgi:hypothetical protein